MEKYEVRGTSVVEVATNQIIFECSNMKKIREVVRGLNNGVGFAGWTPEFILKDKPFGSIRVQC